MLALLQEGHTACKLKCRETIKVYCSCIENPAGMAHPICSLETCPETIAGTGLLMLLRKK